MKFSYNDGGNLPIGKNFITDVSWVDRRSQQRRAEDWGTVVTYAEYIFDSWREAHGLTNRNIVRCFQLYWENYSKYFNKNLYKNRKVDK